MKPLLLPLLIAALSLDLAVEPLHAAGTERIAVHSTADQDYEVRKFPKEGPRPESYILMEGSFFAGTARDRSVTQMTFRDLVTTLAHDLAKQDYFPTTEKYEADLLIVVHWGTTPPGDVNPFVRDMLMERTNEVLQEMLNSDDPLAALGMTEIQSINRSLQMSVEQSIAKNAELLGFTEALMRERRRPSARGLTTREEQMRDDLMEERYFVILTAWDNQALVQDQNARLLWSTRFSMRATGKNFTEALPALTRAASGYFGRQLDDLKTVRTHLGEGDVEMSEIEILGTEPAANSSKEE